MGKIKGTLKPPFPGKRPHGAMREEPCHSRLKALVRPGALKPMPVSVLVILPEPLDGA